MNVLDWFKAIIVEHCHPLLEHFCTYIEQELQWDVKTCQNMLYQLRNVTEWFVHVIRYDGLVSDDLQRINFFFKNFLTAFGKKKKNKRVDNSFENMVRRREMPANGMESLTHAVISEKNDWLANYIG